MQALYIIPLPCHHLFCNLSAAKNLALCSPSQKKLLLTSPQQSTQSNYLIFVFDEIEFYYNDFILI